MRVPAVLGTCAAALGCGGGPVGGMPPAPRPGPPSAAAEATPGPPFGYRLRGPFSYEFARYDTLAFSGAGAGAPQISGKLGVVGVHPAGAQVEISLDSLEAAPGSRLTPAATDSAVGARWQVRLTPTGPAGPIAANRRTIAVEQIAEVVRLLLPSLPKEGLKAQASWTDSTSYPIEVDAFQAVESATRRSRVMPSGGASGVAVEEHVTRTGRTTQAGQGMTMTATGRRTVSYELGPEGWVRALTGRDSLELRVTVSATGQIIPVQWRTSFSARARAPAAR